MTDRQSGTGASHNDVAHEPAQPVTNIEKGTDIDKLASLDDQLDDSVSASGPTERTAERDERGRI